MLDRFTSMGTVQMPDGSSRTIYIGDAVSIGFDYVDNSLFHGSSRILAHVTGHKPYRWDRATFPVQHGTRTERLAEAWLYMSNVNK